MSHCCGFHSFAGQLHQVSDGPAQNQEAHQGQHSAIACTEKAESKELSEFSSKEIEQCVDSCTGASKEEPSDLPSPEKQGADHRTTHPSSTDKISRAPSSDAQALLSNDGNGLRYTDCSKL